MSKNQLLEYYEELDDSNDDTKSSQKRQFPKAQVKEARDGSKIVYPRPGSLA